jgi:hypothetical protein
MNRDRRGGLSAYRFGDRPAEYPSCGIIRFHHEALPARKSRHGQFSLLGAGRWAGLEDLGLVGMVRKFDKAEQISGSGRSKRVDGWNPYLVAKR